MAERRSPRASSQADSLASGAAPAPARARGRGRGRGRTNTPAGVAGRAPDGARQQAADPVADRPNMITFNTVDDVHMFEDADTSQDTAPQADDSDPADHQHKRHSRTSPGHALTSSPAGAGGSPRACCQTTRRHSAGCSPREAQPSKSVRQFLFPHVCKRKGVQFPVAGGCPCPLLWWNSWHTHRTAPQPACARVRAYAISGGAPCDLRAARPLHGC